MTTGNAAPLDNTRGGSKQDMTERNGVTMTEQEREQAFYNAMREAERKFGCTAIAITQAEKLGEAVLVKTGIQIVPIAGWTPPPEPEAQPSFAQELLDAAQMTAVSSVPELVTPPARARASIKTEARQ